MAGCHDEIVLFSLSKNPCGNSGTPQPAASPGVPLFPCPKNFGGHNSRNLRSQAGVVKGSPAGMEEVISGSVRKTEDGEGWDGERGRVPSRGYAGILAGDVRDKEEFGRAKNSKGKSVLDI